MQIVALVLASAVAVAGCAASGGSGASLDAGASSDGADAKPGIIERAKDWVAGQQSDRPLITGLHPGKYEPAATAIGVERDLARRRGELFGLVQDHSLHRYVNRLRDDLIKVSGVTDVPGNTYLVATPELQARATADGNIFLSIAWLDNLENEDQLAGLIAHELAHVLLRHHASDAGGRYHKRGVAAYQLALKIRSQAESSRLSAADVERSEQADLSIKLMDLGIMPVWGRRQEQQADLLANDLLVRAGYNMNGLTEMLAKLQAFEEATTKSEEQVNEEIQSLAATDFKAALKLAGATLMRTISADHPPTGERIENLPGYQDVHYSEAELPTPKVKPYKEATKAASRIIANYRKTYDARRLMLEKDFRKAYPMAKEGVGPPTRTAVYPNWVLFLAANSMGRQDEAFVALERAYRNPADPVNAVYREYSEALGERRRYGDALTVAERAYKVFDESPAWLPLRIKWLVRLHRKKEAESLAAECGLQHSEFKEPCLAALTPTAR